MKSRTEIYYKADKNGKTRAYRFERLQFRAFPISIKEANKRILEGTANLIEKNPFALDK